MTTGSDAMWTLAERFDVIPSPPDPVLAGVLSSWWHGPRIFGCAAARREAAWFVVAPDPSIWCRSCATSRFGDERRCVYCRKRVRVTRANVLLFEMRAGTWVMARSHYHCAERAGRTTDA